MPEVNEMGGKKTRDGHKISDLTKLIRKIGGIEIVSGSKHPFLLKTENQIACPLGPSTHARQMLVPWLAQATGYQNKEVYSAIQSRRWYN
mgnify:CR=1 FL=1|jgi:hypothetical protein